MIQTTNLNDKLNRARLTIFLDEPMFGYLLQKINIYFRDDIKTAATDGINIYFSPIFLKELTMDETIFVLLHELLHIVLKHPKNSVGKIHSIYNIAADYVVNDTLIFFGYEMGSINGIKSDDKIGYYKTSDEIYKRLLSNTEFINLYLTDDHGLWDGKEHLEIDKIIFRGINEGYFDGNKTRSMSRHILKKTKSTPRVDWQNLLRQYLTFDIYDFSYKRVNQNISNVLMPKYITDIETIKNIWLTIDVSGSIDDDELNLFIGEIINLFNSFKELTLKVSFFSTIVTKPVEVNSVNEFKEMLKTIKSTGGTSFNIIFNKMNEYFKIKPKAIIILTDGYADFPKSPSIPVFWAINNEEVKPPFGKVLRI